MTAPGWYHAQGDPQNTHRWWDGTAWVGTPQLIQPSIGAAPHVEFPGAPPTPTGTVPDTNPTAFDWMLLPFKRWSDFSGRSCRAEFWWFQLFATVTMLSLLLITVLAADALGGAPGGLFIAGFVIAALLFAIPNLGVSVRRLHDTDRSGLWMAIGIIPIVSYIGGFVLLAFYVIDGTPGHNSYGPSPKAAHQDQRLIQPAFEHSV